MFIENINKNIHFHDDSTYTYDNLIHHIKCAQYNISKILDKPSTIAFFTSSSFFELVSLLAFLEMGHKILFIKKKHMFLLDMYDDVFENVDLVVSNLYFNHEIKFDKKIVTVDELMVDNGTLELIIETDFTKTGFQFFSSGSTGEPKMIEQTHRRLIHAAQQTGERIWVDNKNYLLYRGNTINHLGIFTTTYLPALFYGENVSWYEHSDIEDSNTLKVTDDRPIYNCLLLFTYQNKMDITNLPIEKNTKVITGGSTITDNFIDHLFSNENIESIYNVYGATEIITPIMWVKIDRKSKVNEFNEILDGLIFNVNSKNNVVKSVSGFIDSNEVMILPDKLTKVDNKYRYGGRSNNNIVLTIKPGKSKVEVIDLTEDEIIKIIENEIGEFANPKPIIYINKLDDREEVLYTLVYDPQMHSNIDKLTMNEVNEIIYNYYEITEKDLKGKLFNNVIPLEKMSSFNNGLKLDKGMIWSIIYKNVKLNKKIKKLL